MEAKQQEIVGLACLHEVHFEPKLMGKTLDLNHKYLSLT